MPTFREDVKLGTKVPLIRSDDISDGAVTLDKLGGDVIGSLTGIERISDAEIDTVIDENLKYGQT